MGEDLSKYKRRLMALGLVLGALGLDLPIFGLMALGLGLYLVKRGAIKSGLLLTGWGGSTWGLSFLL